MLIVDASCLYEVVGRAELAAEIEARLAASDEQAAPHVIDVEVLNIVRREHLRGVLDVTAATQAVDDLRTWPGERYSHRSLLERAWELRHNVRGCDAFYVALAEAFDATLLTTDRRLADAKGPRCAIDVVVAE